MIDARIIGEMISDCRISYNALAEKLEMTANAIRGRVSKLLEAGVLCFDVCLSYAQVGAQPLLVEVRMESNVTSDNIIEELGQHLLIYVVTPLPDGHLILVADYRSPVEMANLLQFVRTRESVVDISSHSLITAQGKKGDINLDQVRVLKSLLDEVAISADDDMLTYLKPKTHLVKGRAQREIPALVEKIEADLVVMGTVARTGIPGFFMGNTAETILNQINCSVLAIKPPGFVTPITLEE